MGLKIMSLREERSYLEDMILEGVTVTQARVEDGREVITVCFRGRLLDYVLDKVSGKLLLGSLAYPATFQEYWDLERPRGKGPWVLQDIRDGWEAGPLSHGDRARDLRSLPSRHPPPKPRNGAEKWTGALL